MRREIEIVILAFFGYMSYLIGMKMDYVGYEFFFYILTAIFFFSIFRPKASPQNFMAMQLSWLEHTAHIRAVAGSSPAIATIYPLFAGTGYLGRVPATCRKQPNCPKKPLNAPRRPQPCTRRSPKRSPCHFPLNKTKNVFLW